MMRRPDRAPTPTATPDASEADSARMQPDVASLSRREFAARVLSIRIATTLGAAGLAAPAAAEVVTTVVAIVGICLKIASMMGPSGPSPQDLMRLQTNLLRLISEQLRDIQAGIRQILADLNDLRKIAKTIPSETVSIWHRTQIEALAQLYGQQMQSYAAAVSEPGGSPSSAQDLYGRRIEERILNPISTSRATFTNPSSSSTYMDVPSLCTAMQIELHSMIMAGQKRRDLVPVIATYREWFGRMLKTSSPSIEGALAEARAARAKIFESLAAARGRDICYRNHEMKDWTTQRRVSRGEYETVHHTYNMALAMVAKYRYDTAEMPLSEIASGTALVVFTQQVSSLVKTGDIAPAELPLKLVPVVDKAKDDLWVEYNSDDNNNNPEKSNAPDFVPVSEVTRAFIHGIRGCDNKVLSPVVTDEAKSLQAQLFDNSMTLLMHGALRRACRSALASLDKFEKAI
jgi:hypothetical protein